jgi:hypothetical protein
MYVEIDSTEIIAFLINKSNCSHKFEIPFSKIQKIAKVIESENQDILTFCDSISIDAFRCAFTSNVIVEDSTIIIEDIQIIRSNIERLLPSQRIIELLEKINKE